MKTGRYISKQIADIVSETLKPLPKQKAPHIVAGCRHDRWHIGKEYCLDCHVTREALFFGTWKGNN